MFEILGKAMDEVAREFRAVDRDDPKRGPLLEELSGVDTAQTLAEVRAQ